MTGHLALQVRRAGSVGIVAIQGYLNNTGGEQLARTCEALTAEGVRQVVLNLAGTRLVNSVGVSFLIEAIEKVQALEGQVAFCCVLPTIAKTFQIMGLLKMASLHPTEQEAVRSLRR